MVITINKGVKIKTSGMHSTIGRFISLLSKLAGAIILWGNCILIHWHLLVVICFILGIDICTYPDTLEYQLIFAYLLLTQYVFIVWFCPRVDKILSYLVKPIKILGNKLEEKFGNDRLEEKK